jgi:hypothetical protein
VTAAGDKEEPVQDGGIYLKLISGLSRPSRELPVVDHAMARAMTMEQFRQVSG